MGSEKPLYNLDDPVFKKNFIYKRLAMEHVDLEDMQSDVMEIKVLSTIGPIRVPNKYSVTYNLRTITGINEDLSPIFGNQHVAEIELPKRYPLESAMISMKTPVWHPNIQYHGKFKGRICGNTQNFGKGFGLRQLALRIGEILQYKNYHAEHTHPFPEDGKVADWVSNYAEPKGILSKDKGLVIDNSSLLRIRSVQKPEEPKSKIKFKFKGGG